MNTVVDAKTAAALALAARGLVTSSDTTASAPTTLGTTARTILALLAQYPEAAPAVQGRAPLWNANGAPGQTAGQTPSGQQAAATAGQPTPAATPAPAQPAAAASLATAADTAAATKLARPAGPADANAARGADAAAHASQAASGPTSPRPN
ncbi:hypothetical protein G6F35_016377 [Rhizopus arrhizus]|nr:hypothetical protein G6F35_016377 [Rhizopus arrhizus]